ncbi:unnamed protein product [Closterium sp. NIES-54]
MLLDPEGDPDAPDIPTPCSYEEAIEHPYSSQVKRPPGSLPVFKARYVARGFSQRQGVDFFQTISPTPKITTLRVLLHVPAQRDYELHSLEFSTAFLQGSLHEEIWLRRPPGFTGSFPAGTQWSLRTTLAALGFAPSTADPSLFLRTDTTLPPFYVLVYVDDLVFATADPEARAHVKSELQKRHTCTDLSELTSYLGLRITRDRAQRTITLTQSHMVQQVLQRFGFTYSLPQSTPLPTGHSLSAPPSDESVEPSGPYPELVGCLMYLMTCTLPDLAYPLSILARYVAPGRHRKEHIDAAKRVLRYLCSTSGMGLVLGGRARVVLTGHADASWVDDLATQRSSQGYTFSLGSGSVSWRSTRSSSVLSSSCEAEIYAGAMAAKELRWLTYLLTDLGEAPRSPPVLYVDNKAMLALCPEHRLEHRTKHIAVRYFHARELQQRCQLHLTYVSTQANTADIFTKALQPCDHQRFCTMLGLVVFTALFVLLYVTLHVNWPCGHLLVLRMCGDIVIHPELALPFLTGLVTSCSPPLCLWGFPTCTHLLANSVIPFFTFLTLPCSCRLLSLQTLLWHHRPCHPSLPLLRGMHSRLLFSGLLRSLPPLPPSPAPLWLPCVDGRLRGTPHSSSSPPDDCSPGYSPHGREEVLRLGVLSLGVAEPAGAEPGGAEFEVAGSGGAEPGGAELGGTEPTGAELEGTEPAGAESGGAEPRGTASSGGPAGASPRLSPRPEPLSPQQLREWFARRTRLRSGAAGARDSAAGGTRARGAGANRLGGVGVPAGAAGPGCACPRGTGAAGAGGAGGAGARDLGVGGSGAVDPGARGTGDAGAGDQSARSAGAVDPGAEGAGAGGATSGSTRAKGTVQWRPFFVPPPPSSLPPPDSVLRQVLGLSSSTSLPPSLLRPPPRQSQPQLQPNSPLPAPSPFAEQTDSFTHCREPESRPTSPIRAVHTGRRVPRPRPPPVRGTHIMALCPPSVPVRVPLPPPPESSLPAVPNPESDLARAARPTVTHLLPSVVTDPSFESTAASTLVAELVYFALPIVSTTPLDFECLAAGVPHLVAMLLAPEVDPDAPDIPTTCSYAEAITGPYSSQWQTAMDAEMASWKSTDTYVSAVPPSRANIVDGMWIFRVKQLPGSPPVFKARYVARGFSQRQGVDFFQTFSPTPKMTTLQILHEEIWLRRPPGFTGSFPAHPSLFLCTDTLLALFYILVYVDDLVFATSDTEALSLVKSELQKRHICTDLGELRNYLGLQITRDKARRTITMTQSHMVHHVLQRFGFQHSSPQPTPLPTGHSLCVTFLLESCSNVATQRLSQGYTFSLGSSSVSWRSSRSSSVLGSSCEAEIYAWVIAAQELRWLTYLLTDLGEWLRSPPVLYVNLKAMIVLFREQRLEHRTKHIALRYFIARELQQRCQLRLSYVASRANTADVFTKALSSGDLQRFCTALVLLPVLLHMLVS